MSQINKTIAGRYILKELIGQGGMADVYLAEDKILERTVAVKIMRSSLTGDPVYVTRFHREARAAASLSHRNIVRFMMLEMKMMIIILLWNMYRDKL